MNRRRWWIALGVSLGLLLGAALLLQLAVQRLRHGIEQALGPRASVGALHVGWTGIELRDLKVRADPAHWPAADELRATRVTVVPELWSSLRSGWHVRSVEVEGAYISVLRTRDGRLRLLPSLLPDTPAPAKKPASAADGAAPTVRIDSVQLEDGAFDFYDASVRQPPHRMRIEALDVQAGPLHLPALQQPVKLALKGRFKGPQHDGDIRIDGHVTPATKDGQLKIRLAGVDLIALQPYLLRVHEAGVKRGTLDLRLDATMAANRLHAPGQLTLVGLELGSSSALGTFAGVPRQAVVAAMSRDGRIELQFTLEGRLDDPKFSLNEAFALRLAAGLAEKLGVSVSGVVEGLGSVVKGLFGR